MIPDELLADSLGLLREAADRELGLRPFPVQLLGRGRPGPRGLAGNGHRRRQGRDRQPRRRVGGVDRAADSHQGAEQYLAARDALPEHFSRSINSVASPSVALPVLGTEERVLGYGKDVTYTTSKEVVADFLRDRLGWVVAGPISD